MTRFLSLEEVLELHRKVLTQSGGMEGVRDLGAVESALAQPQMTFASQELYLTLAEKAAAPGSKLTCANGSRLDPTVRGINCPHFEQARTPSHTFTIFSANA